MYNLNDVSKAPVGPERHSTYCACIHGEPGFRTLKASRSEPRVSRLAFKFQAPDFDTDAELAAYFAETFFPLQVVFDDEQGQEHPSDGALKTYAEARRFMSAIATMKAVETYDERLRTNRTVQLRRVRLLTKDGRMLDERDAPLPK